MWENGFEIIKLFLQLIAIPILWYVRKICAEIDVMDTKVEGLKHEQKATKQAVNRLESFHMR